MDIYRKLRQLIRLKTEAPIHQLVEHHDLAILEQDLRDTQALIKQHKLQLAGTRADIKLIAQDCDHRQQTITRLEESALAAMHENHEEAENLASHIAEEETYLVEQKDRLRQLRDAEQRMLREITQAARLVQQSQHQLIVLRANESLHGKRGG